MLTRIAKPFISLLLLIFITACTHIPYTSPLADTPAANAAVDALVPNYLSYDKQVLMRHLIMTGCIIIYEKSAIHLFIPPDASFKPGSSLIRTNLMGILDYVVAYLNAYPSSGAILRCRSETNNNLSLRRADSIVAYLEMQGIMPYQFLTKEFTPYNSTVPLNHQQIEIILVDR